MTNIHKKTPDSALFVCIVHCKFFDVYLVHILNIFLMLWILLHNTLFWFLIFLLLNWLLCDTHEKYFKTHFLCCEYFSKHVWCLLNFFIYQYGQVNTFSLLIRQQYNKSSNTQNVEVSSSQARILYFFDQILIVFIRKICLFDAFLTH